MLVELPATALISLASPATVLILVALLATALILVALPATALTSMHYNFELVPPFMLHANLFAIICCY